MSSEKEVIGFLARYRSILDKDAYASMIACGANCVRADLHEYTVVAGPSKSGKKPAVKKNGKPRPAAKPADDAPVLAAPSGLDAERVLQHLRVLKGSWSSAEIAGALATELNVMVEQTAVAKVIKKLLKDNLVIQHGTRRGAKYEAVVEKSNVDGTVHVD